MTRFLCRYRESHGENREKVDRAERQRNFICIVKFVSLRLIYFACNATRRAARKYDCTFRCPAVLFKSEWSCPRRRVTIINGFLIVFTKNVTLCVANELFVWRLLICFCFFLYGHLINRITYTVVILSGNADRPNLYVIFFRQKTCPFADLSPVLYALSKPTHAVHASYPSVKFIAQQRQRNVYKILEFLYNTRAYVRCN